MNDEQVTVSVHPLLGKARLELKTPTTLIGERPL